MGKSIAVYLPDYRIDILEDDVLKGRITDLSFGRDGHHTSMNATALSDDREVRHWSHAYSAWMPYAMFFNDGSGCAFHEGNTSIPSHGCIHLSEANAQWLFGWAGSDPVSLQISGPYPDLQVSAKIYKEGVAGMCQETIAAIQTALQKNGQATADPAGVFGPGTTAAVQAYQTAKGLTADGAVGPDTASHLGVTL